MHLLNTELACSRWSAQRQMNIVCNSRSYCCTLICPFALPKYRWEEKTNTNNFIKSDYKPEYEYLTSNGIRPEVGRISKSPCEMLIELKRSNSSPIFTLHNSSLSKWNNMTCKLVQDTTRRICRYTVKVIVWFHVNMKEMISDHESTRTDSLFLIIIIFFFWNNSSDKTTSSNCLLASVLGKPSWLLTQMSSPASKLLA